MCFETTMSKAKPWEKYDTGFLDRLHYAIEKNSDTHIKHYEAEIKYVEEQTRLSLWLLGLSLGLEFFVLNKITDLGILSNSGRWWFYGNSVVFLLNMAIGLSMRIKQTKVQQAYLQISVLFDSQKADMLNQVKLGGQYTKEYVADFKREMLFNKIAGLKYTSHGNLLRDTNMIRKIKVLTRMNYNIISLFIIQTLLSVIVITIHYKN